MKLELQLDRELCGARTTANAGPLKNFPKGYALGDEHAPHISVMGGYVYTAGLDKLFTAAAKVLAGEKGTNWKLKAFKYYYIPFKEIGLGGLMVECKGTDRCCRTIRGASQSWTSAAFATTPKDPEINQPTIDLVAPYLAEHSRMNLPFAPQFPLW